MFYAHNISMIRKWIKINDSKALINIKAKEELLKIKVVKKGNYMMDK